MHITNKRVRLVTAAVIGLFCGFMTATAGNSFFPPLGKFVTSFLCNGEVIFNRKGLFDFAVCIDVATGQSYSITFVYLFVATFFYGAIYFMLLCLGWLFGKMLKK